MEAASSDAGGDRLLDALRRLMEGAQSYELLPGTGDPVRVDGRGHGETWADVLRLQAEGIEPAAFAAITCPALMLHGDDDPHPGPATFELLRRFMPQLRYRGFPRCGHKPWAERHAREPFLAALREWLRVAGEGRAANSPVGGRMGCDYYCGHVRHHLAPGGDQEETVGDRRPGRGPSRAGGAHPQRPTGGGDHEPRRPGITRRDPGHPVRPRRLGRDPARAEEDLAAGRFVTGEDLRRQFPAR